MQGWLAWMQVVISGLSLALIVVACILLRRLAVSFASLRIQNSKWAQGAMWRIRGEVPVKSNGADLPVGASRLNPHKLDSTWEDELERDRTLDDSHPVLQRLSAEQEEALEQIQANRLDPDEEEMQAFQVARGG